MDGSSKDNACAVLAPGRLPKKPAIGISEYHRAAGHSHEVLRRKTAEQQGIALEGKLLECRGCFMAKSLRKGIKQSTRTRADKKLGRVVVDLCGPKVVVSREETVYSHRARRFFTYIHGCILCATSRTPRKCSSNSSRILVQTVPLPRW